MISPIILKRAAAALAEHIPISLLCSISKFWRELVSIKSIIDFLLKTTISDSQYGFVKNLSTLHQLLLHSEFLFDAYQSRQQVDTIYLDIKKAFDMVPHSKLLSKLWKIGISGKLVALLWSLSLSLHKKKILKRNLADVGLNQWMHWLTKHTNKECHSQWYVLHNMATLFNIHPYISSSKLVLTGICHC